MSSGNHIRTRSDRVAAIALPPGALAQAWANVRRGPVIGRALLAVVAAAVMWIVSGSSAPTFSYRIGDTPSRDITSRVAFSVENQEETRLARERARRAVVCIYQNNPQPLVELRQALKVKLLQVLAAKSFQNVDAADWADLLPRDREDAVQDNEVYFAALQAAFDGDKDLAKFESALHRALSDFERYGLIAKLQHELKDGSQSTIDVRPQGKHINVDQVLLFSATPKMRTSVAQVFAKEFKQADHAQLVSRLVNSWMEPRLENAVTLSLDQDVTAKARQLAGKSVATVTKPYPVGSVLAAGGKPITDRELALLKTERTAFAHQLSLWERIVRSFADAGMYVALYCLCGGYIIRRDPQLIRNLGRYAVLLGIVVLTTVLAQVASRDQWPAQIIPLILFGMTLAITSPQDVALLLTSSISLAVVLSQGLGLRDFVVYLATCSVAIALTGHVRSRTKLIYVGIFAGVVAAFTTVGVHTVIGQPLSQELLLFASWTGFCSVLAGFVMVGLLPFVERILDVQTDISLLELGDAAHPLLQELSRRAPGTYNHSLNVASMAEAAAEAIGAHGLLVRVGAYFHDIGKMLKPDYFVENQGLHFDGPKKETKEAGKEANSHESLMPAMSTLVIIAHVKDGADLARQHHLPQSIIDFIEQHHGTTLVEYFYQQEALRSEEDPDSGEIDETSFRYPGPKPQTKEAAVMMLADAVESASRTLVDPTPARIEGLVNDIAMKKLLDGQFDECSLTLRELHLIEDSLSKTLNSVYHARIKYPDQQTA